MTENDTRPRVVLADDHAMVRDALARVMEESGGVRIVGQVSHAADLPGKLTALSPDCLVLDYSMPGLEMPGVIATLLVEHPDLKILVLTLHQNIQYAVNVLEAGAHGYVIKAAAVEELLQAIQAVLRGDLYVSTQLAQDVLKVLRSPKRERKGMSSLSQRELEVMRMLTAGRSLQQCAQSLDLSTSTVSTYRARILEKLELETTAELIRYSLEHERGH